MQFGDAFPSRSLALADSDVHPTFFAMQVKVTD